MVLLISILAAVVPVTTITQVSDPLCRGYIRISLTERKVTYVHPAAHRTDQVHQRQQ